MHANEPPADPKINLRNTLKDQTKEHLVILAKKLRVRHARKHAKDELIEQILLLPEPTIRQALHISWWDKYHNHVYGIGGVAMTVIAGWWFWHEGPSAKKQDETLETVHWIKTRMEAVQKEDDSVLKAEFNLGYRLFGIANNEFFPFQGPPDQGILVHWERNQHKYESDRATMTLHLPDIDLLPNMMLHGVTVQLPNVVGARLSFHLDPVFYKHGTAIIRNTWVKSTVKTNTSAGGSPFPPETKITELTHAAVNWGTAGTYTLGALKMRGNELWIDGGTLTVGQADAFDHVSLVRGNIFNGSPRGGYRFPRAGVIMGNEFREGSIEARSLADGVIVTGNRFVSSAGGFTIGPQPEVSFVIEIVQTQTNGAVLLFGLKSYVE